MVSYFLAIVQVGKLVNIARLMGLAIDPDESPGLWTIFEAEMRRRVWWDIVFYDVYVPSPLPLPVLRSTSSLHRLVSDCMGQPDLVTEHSYTTKMPKDLDDDPFLKRQQILPLPSLPAISEDGKMYSQQENGFQYFQLKCRCVCLLCRRKSRIV
jgi:hypothetical protein